MKILINSLFSFLLLTTIAMAKTPPSTPQLDEYFEQLSHEDVDFEPVGAVCERVAVREIEPLYPAVNFDVVNSIQYDDKKTTIGELDLVIFNKSTQKVEAIAEVKCWKNFKSALHKARDQRARFMIYLNRNIVLSDKNGKKYSKDLFKNVQKYFTISQAGGTNEGFDFELSLDLKELMRLRSKLLDCKTEGRCPVR